MATVTQLLPNFILFCVKNSERLVNKKKSYCMQTIVSIDGHWQQQKQNIMQLQICSHIEKKEEFQLNIAAAK